MLYISEPNSKQPYADLATSQWRHGAKSCKNDTNPAIKVMQADASTYVLRQNKYVSFEAPFIYILFDQDKLLLVNTGAKQSPEISLIYQTVESLIALQGCRLNNKPEVLVVHSHSDYSNSDYSKGNT